MQATVKSKEDIIELIISKVPRLLAVYAFGSRITNNSNKSSDLDIALLVEGYSDPLDLFYLASELEDLAGYPVDLLDFRAASTVMQYQVITTGLRWWEKDSQAAVYESMVLSEKTALDSARLGLIADIEETGSIYSR